ncbi:MAG: hypothetical protein JXA18_01755 [Chitinispirillaceae bacterium]|nr:hypothetical protein [Chitinispirillaceae bacterium]
MRFVFNGKGIRSTCWFYASIAILLGGMNSQATKVTVDADGGADYTSLDSVLMAIGSGSLDPDTVEFIGSDQDSFPWTTYVGISIGSIIFRGRATDPSKFPVINHSGNNSYNFFNATSVSFENCILNTTIGFHLGQSSQTHTFKRCVIRDCSSSYAFYVAGTGGSTAFENCLFEGNAATNVFDINFWGGTPTFTLMNCTFDNNTSIWDEDPDTAIIAEFAIVNCIFSNNATTFRGDNLRGKTAYSLTSEALTGYGTGCVSNADPLYGVAAVASRSAPADWRPTSASPACNLGTLTNAPDVDISDTIRIQDSTGRRDAGCWDIREAVQPPVITKHPPADTSVGVGKPLVVRIVATGTEPLTYSWRRIGSATPVSEYDSMQIAATALTDDGEKYICVVKNSSDSAFSDTMRLHVVDLPVIVDYPDDSTVYSGDTAAFAITATGENIAYQWKHNGTGIEDATSAVYEIPNVELADSGLYVCFVTTIAGSDSSNPVRLRVLPPAPSIIDRTPDTILAEGDSITLEVVAQGKPPLQYAWIQAGDSTVLSKDAFLTLTDLTQAGSVVYRCIVSNDAGNDSVDIRLMVSTTTLTNPLRLTTAFIDPTRIKLTISNFTVLPFSGDAPAYVDTVGVWFSSLTFPTGILSPEDTNCITIPLQQMRAGGTDTYDTSVQIFANAPDECKFLYMVVAPFWKTPETVIAAVSTDQRDTVSMCSSDSLQNMLVIDIDYQRVNDSIVVTINNLTSIDRDSLMYLIIAYGVGTGAFKADSIEKVYPADLPEASEDLFSRTYHDAGFAGLEDSATVRVSWRGILGNTSPAKEKKIGVGRLRPVNTAELFIDSATTASLYLHWRFGGTADFDTIRIWWGRDSVPLAADFAEGTYTPIPIEKHLTGTVITGLLSGIRYGVGLQVGKENVWSFVTSDSRDTATTKSLHTTVLNTIDNVSAVFDTATNHIDVAWDVDTAGIGSLNNMATGIVVAVGVPPGGTTVPDDAYGKIVTNPKAKGNTASIDLGNELLFDTTYHVALLLRREGEGWAAATDASRDTVAVPSPSWQRVVYFSGDDTVVTAFNQAVKLWKRGGGAVSVVDTLRVFKPAAPPRGFVVVSRIGFDFVKDNRSDSINIGLRYDAALLGGLRPEDIRMYQYDPDGGWSVDEHSMLNAAQRIVSVAKRASDNPDPFILMIDTLRPLIHFISDTGTPVSPDRDVTDTIAISDNVVNSTARLFYWRIVDTDEVSVSTKQCTAENDTITITVPDDSISDDRSIRVLLVISDGRFVTTADISRTVTRLRSDEVGVLPANRWIPIGTTARLNDNSVETALNELRTSDKWEYDSIHFRIYRWVDTASARVAAEAKNDTNWVEYRPADSDLFDLVPGRVVWVKSRKDKRITSLGAGVTVSVKHPYAITLNANEWTDIALPYNFNIRIGDILRETSVDTAVTNRIQIYRWETGDAGTLTRPKHIPTIPGMDSAMSSLTCERREDGIGTYSIFNASTTDIELRIPPVPDAFSSYAVPRQAKGKAPAQAGWSLVVEAHTDKGNMTPVFCGFKAGKGVSRFPVSHSFSKQRVLLIDAQRNTVHGNLVFHEAQDGGFVFPLLFSNDDAQTVQFTYNIIVPPTLPVDFGVGIYDPAVKHIVDARPEQHLSIDAHAKAYRWLLVGDSSYLASWSGKLTSGFALLVASPNPCRDKLLIQFTVPYDDVQCLQAALFDQLGRRLWNENLTRKAFRPGLNRFMLQPGRSGPLGAGTYVIRLSAFDSKGRFLGARQQRMVYLP